MLPFNSISNNMKMMQEKFLIAEIMHEASTICIDKLSVKEVCASVLQFPLTVLSFATTVCCCILALLLLVDRNFLPHCSRE